MQRYRARCDFQDGGCCHLRFSKIWNFNTWSPVRGQYASPCRISSKSVKQLLRYMSDVLPSVLWFNRPILHHLTKFHIDRSNCCRGIAIFVIFDYKDGGRRHLLGFSKLRNCNDGSTISVQCASLCKMSSKSGKRLQRHGDLTVLFKMAAVCHLGFAGHVLRPPTMTTWRSLSLCTIMLK